MCSDESRTARDSAHCLLAELPLFAVRVDTWERMVFVNLDLAAQPLADYLEAVPDDIGWLGLGDFRCYATMTVDVDANWKTIADGFSETYHIQTLHPELHRCMDDVYAPQTIWGLTGKSEQLYGLPSPHLKHALTDAEVWDAYVCTQGALMGVAEGTPFPGGGPRPDVIAESYQRFRRRPRSRSELGQHRSGDAAAPVQHFSQHDIAGQRRSPDRAGVAAGSRSRPRRTRDDAVDAHDARCAAMQARRRTTGLGRGRAGSGSDSGYFGAVRAAAWSAPTRAHAPDVVGTKNDA